MDEDLTDTTVVVTLGAMLLEHLLNVADVLIVATAEEVILVIVVVSGYSCEFVRHIIMGLGATADSNAGDGAKHDGQAEEGDEDQNVGVLLLVIEVEEVGVVGLRQAGDSHNITNQERDD